MTVNFAKIFLSALILCMITGCSPSFTFTIHDPEVSSFQYDAVPAKKLIIRVVDQRKDLVFQRPISGLKNFKITLENVENPIQWFSTALEKEFTARGIPVEVKANDQPVAADMTLTVKTYQIVSHKVSGFSPWETFHSFQGELTAGDQTSSIIAYFTNGHVPKWAVYEVENPCFEIPMSIVVKDVASKINQRVFKYQAGKDNLDKIKARISEKIKTDSDEACLPAIELGATNNLDGLKTLVELADNQNQFVRACSLSAIGTLEAHDQLEFLKNKFIKYDYIDRFMALKSIGDIGTPEAIDFIKKSRNDTQYQSEKGFLYLVNLYL